AYRVNPNVVFKGSRNGRLNVLYQYNTDNQSKKETE
ncbi:replication/maintenance protein RepL, partial [Paraclostridium sordellii]